MAEMMHMGFSSQAMMNRGQGSGNSRSHSRADRTRRSWNDREEQFLLGTLKELVARGWKSDNGFWAGCLQKCEEMMQKEFPGTDLKMNPHIHSKIHTWKNNYSALSLVLGRSGVSFNHHGDHKIDCDDAEWKEILKVDSGARLLRNKSWPYYEDWKVIFGKDRASGDDSVDAREAFNQTGTQVGNENIDISAEYEEVFTNNFGLDNASPDSQTDSVFSSAIGSQKEGGQPKKKRKGVSALDGLVDVIAKMHEATNMRLEYLANRIGYEFDLTKARKEVFQLVGTIPGLSLMQVFDASENILSKVEHLDFFMSLPEMARQAYVFRALDKMAVN
ncbi:hypothetical protein AAHA92_10050 [Salvia divinorum]|uniref:Myb/SANT-like domain-containing protein n=1 Tax=Salvia divinorum TaxID=28513 RepID=A0ABD1HU88_SALDI